MCLGLREIFSVCSSYEHTHFRKPTRNLLWFANNIPKTKMWDVIGLLLASGQRELTQDHSSHTHDHMDMPHGTNLIVIHATWRGKRTQERVAFNRRSNLITNVSFTQARTCTSKVGRGQRPDLFKLGVEPPARHAHYLDTVYGFREWRKEGGVPVLAQRLVIPVSE